MRSLSRIFLLLPALILALVLIPTVVMSAAGSVVKAPLADTLLSAGVFDQNSVAAMSRPPGTVPPPPSPLPSPLPTPAPPRPVPPGQAPAPTPVVASDKAMIYPHAIEKVIGDRLSPTIYAFTNNDSLYRSDDNGRIWFLIRSQLEVDDFVMSSADPNVLYSGKGADCSDPSASNEPFYQSLDGGYTWDEMPTAINLRPLLIDPADPYRLFAADCAMLYLSEDGGMSWVEKPDNSVAQLWMTYRVVDMASASLVGDPTPAQPHWNQLYAIGVDANGVGVIAFSGDEGETWANITDPNRAPEALRVVVAQLKQAGAVWMIAGKGVWATTDFGINWGLTNRGLSSLASAGSLNDLTYAFNGKLYLATVRGLYEKTFDGKMWAKTSKTSFGNENLVSMLLTDSNPDTLWINTKDEGVFIYRIEAED
jgi:hypothetical protein